MRIARVSRMLLVAALGTFIAANLIHNRGAVDPAIVPGSLFTLLMFWKPRRVFLVLAAVALAVPAIAVFKGAALTDPSRQAYFFNHVLLLLTAILATAGLATGVMRGRTAAPASTTH